MNQIPISEEIRRDRERESKEALASLQKNNEDLVKEIFYYSQDSLTHGPNRTIAYFSSLLVNLAKQADESTQKTIKLTEETMKYTKRLHHLTVAIVVLTIVLLLQWFFEFPKIKIQFSQETKQGEQNENQNSLTNKPKRNSEPILPTFHK